MINRKSKKKSPDIEKDDQAGAELHEMQLEKMDFDIVNKILSDHIAEDVFTETEAETAKDDRFLELTVESLEEGLKKAGELLEVPIKELKYKTSEKVLKTIDEEVVELQKIEFRRKLVSGKSQIEISEDKLSAYFSVVFPKTIDDEETDEGYLLNVIKNKKIKYGIQHEEIKKIVIELKENYDALRNVIIAKGKPLVKGKDCEVLYSIFSTLEEINYRETRGKHLLEILDSSSLETIKKDYFPVRYVRKDELIASTTEPGDGEDGIDVFGNKIKVKKGNLAFETGKNVKLKLEEGHINYYSEIFGYLEYEDGALAVHSPIWVSEDFMESYYVRLPAIEGVLKKFTAEELYDQMYDKEVKFGVITEAIEDIVNSQKNGENGFAIKLIASGERERKGDDAKIELFFEKDTRAGKILEDGRIDYREIDIVKTVKSNQLIAVKHHPKEGVMGKSLKGEIIPAPKGDDKKFNALNNIKTAAGKGKILYYSVIEGRVVLVGDTGISVNQQFEIEGNVDFSTGNIEFNGDIHIKGSVVSGFRVKAEGDIIVNETVNQDVELVANGNIDIKQGVIGRNNNTRLIAKGTVLAQYVQSAYIESGSDIVVKDYIMNSVIKAKGEVITPDRDKSHKGTGTIVGGEVIALKGIIANSIGSDYAKMTKIMVGVDFEYDIKIKNFNKGLEFCDHELSKLSKFLKLGFQDINTLKQRVAKLPKEKQKPFIDGFKKLREVSQLRNEIITKKENFSKKMDEISQKAEILVKKELFPRIFIQIGEAKLNTQKLYSGIVRLKESKDRKNIVSAN